MGRFLQCRVGRLVISIVALATIEAGTAAAAPQTGTVDLSKGTATPSEVCGACHVAIYREYELGFGSDTRYGKMTLRDKGEEPFGMPANVSSAATTHAAAGFDPFSVHARESEEEGRSCNVCHFPEAFALPPVDNAEIVKPKARAKGNEVGGLTCASCHLTPDGKIRGPYNVSAAPHATVEDPEMRTSSACAYCHSLGKRVPGKQTQTFLEWREDFHKPDLGRQHCQDCHMLRSQRKAAEDYDVPARAVARHLWTGGHSPQRLASALNLTIVQAELGKPAFEFHVANIAAGHSVPTGSNRRGIYLIAELADRKGKTVAKREWLFAPWYGARPDDRKFLEEDKARPDAKAASQADAQGPHEAIIRAGEERVLAWTPSVKAGDYTVKARLVHDLNRYNDRSFADDQTVMNRSTLKINVAKTARR
ncbi:MAG TPA: hypothetical protein VIU29_04995 [Candidatus Deferrimicrobiaceae bacterium]